MRWTTALVLVAVLTVAGPAAAQEIDDSPVFPIVARTAGAGEPPTQWVTDLTVANVTDGSITVGMKFFPANQPNELDPSFPDQFVLGPRETRMWTDVLYSVFGYTNDVKGALMVTCSEEYFGENPEEADILATTRTYNTGNPEGTYGQTIPASSFQVNVFGDPSFITGARNDSQFRSNLGIVNMSFEAVTIHYRVLDAGGMILVQGQKSMPKACVKQWSFAQLGVGRVQGPLTVDLWLDPEDVTPDPCSSDTPNMFMAYVSKVDGNPEGTGDAEFLYSAPVRVQDWCDMQE